MNEVQLLEGKWVAKSLDGKVRRFKELADAEHWRKNHSKDIIPAKEKGMTFRQYMDWAEKEEEKLQAQLAAMKPKASEIWNKFQTAVGDAFPDGDPIGRMAHWMEQHGLTMHDLDAAVKEYAEVDAYTYLQNMWDDTAADAEHDAIQGHHDDGDGTYDDKWFQRPNPFK